MRRGDSNVKGRGLALWRKVWVCKAVDQSPGFASTVSASGRKEFFRSWGGRAYEPSLMGLCAQGFFSEFSGFAKTPSGIKT
jgi:hypothetical protein